MTFFLFQSVFGIALLFGGSELFMRGAIRMARTWEIPAAAIGSLLIVYGNALAGLVLTYQAAHTGSPDIGFGNIIGVNILSMLLVLGLSAMFCTLTFKNEIARHDGNFMLASSVLLPLLALDGVLEPMEGAGMLVLLMAYSAYVFRTPELHQTLATPPEQEDPETLAKCTIWCAAAYAFTGLALLFTGSDLLIDGSAGLASTLHASEAAIGLTIVALGTSAPMFSFLLAAARQGQEDVGIAYVFTNNTFNTLGIIGLTALMNPIPIAPRFASLDLWVMATLSVFLLFVLLIRRRLGRAEGAVLLALFAVFTLYQYAYG